MDRRTRICIVVIIIGLANFVAYTIGYLFVGGETMNGYVRVDAGVKHYFFAGNGHPAEVHAAVWICSGVHSISVWLSVGAVLLAMLTLAKEGIVSSMRSTVVRGRTFITILATLITFITVVITIWFVLHMVRQLSDPEPLAAAMSLPL